MSVVRRVNRPADNFTMISNEFVRDSRLSFHARGVGGWMLSHAAGWETYFNRLDVHLDGGFLSEEDAHADMPAVKERYRVAFGG